MIGKRSPRVCRCTELASVGGDLFDFALPLATHNADQFPSLAGLVVAFLYWSEQRTFPKVKTKVYRKTHRFGL